ncbi:hypothetical protein Tco_1036628 [Tanacetum coccineum]
METFLCIQDAPCITQEFALESVGLVTRWVIGPGIAEAKDQPREANGDQCLLCDESLVIPMKEIWLDDKLNYVEEPVEIIDREVKQLRQRCIPIIKVRWNSEFTWEHEDQIHAKYPHLFSINTPSLN